MEIPKFHRFEVSREGRTRDRCADRLAAVGDRLMLEEQTSISPEIHAEIPLAPLQTFLIPLRPSYRRSARSFRFRARRTKNMRVLHLPSGAAPCVESLSALLF